MHDALVLGDVAGGEDARHRGLQAGIDHDAAQLADLEPGGSRQPDVGDGADADHDDVGLESGARAW